MSTSQGKKRGRGGGRKKREEGGTPVSSGCALWSARSCRERSAEGLQCSRGRKGKGKKATPWAAVVHEISSNGVSTTAWGLVAAFRREEGREKEKKKEKPRAGVRRGSFSFQGIENGRG